MFGAGYFNPDYFSPSYFGTEEGSPGAAAGTSYGTSTATGTATARPAVRRGGKKRRTTYAPIVIVRAAGFSVAQAQASGLAVRQVPIVAAEATGSMAGTSNAFARASWIDHVALQNERDEQDMQDIRDITDILMLIAA